MRHFVHRTSSLFEVGQHIRNGLYTFDIGEIVPCPGRTKVRGGNVWGDPERCTKCEEKYVYKSRLSGMLYCSSWNWKLRRD